MSSLSTTLIALVSLLALISSACAESGEVAENSSSLSALKENLHAASTPEGMTVASRALIYQKGFAGAEAVIQFSEGRNDVIVNKDMGAVVVLNKRDGEIWVQWFASSLMRAEHAPSELKAKRLEIEYEPIAIGQVTCQKPPDGTVDPSLVEALYELEGQSSPTYLIRERGKDIHHGIQLLDVATTATISVSVGRTNTESSTK